MSRSLQTPGAFSAPIPPNAGGAPSTITLQHLQSKHLSAVSSAFLQVRPKLLLPVGPLLIALLLWGDVSRTQVVALLLMFSVMLSGFLLEARHARRVPTTPRWLFWSLSLTLCGLVVLSTLSGGLRSPFLLMLFAPLGIAFAAFGRSAVTWKLLAAYAVGLLVLGLSPAIVPWPALPGTLMRGMSAIASVLCMALLFLGTTGLSAAHQATSVRLATLRDEVVSAAVSHSEALENMGAQVAHELKNPLASIKALVSLVQDSAGAEQVPRLTQRLEVVLGEVERMQHVLSDYLSFTRPLSALKWGTAELKPYLLEVLQLLEGEAHRRGVQLTLDCAPIQLRFDPHRLRQALLNLAQNAFAAMPHGGLLTITAVEHVGQVTITLVDTGCGMSSETLDRVKEPFFSGTAGGTGLGVVIADSVIRQHQGILLFQSQEGQGTQVSMRFPSVGGEHGQ